MAVSKITLNSTCLSSAACLAIWTAGLGHAQSTACESGWSPYFQDLAYAPAPLGLTPKPIGYALEEFDDGSGLTIYAAAVVDVDGVDENRILRYDSSGSTVVGSGFPGVVTDMEVFDDGSGAALYVAFDTTPTQFVPEPLQRWDGNQWSSVQTPWPFNGVDSLRAWDDGSGPKLYAGIDGILSLFGITGVAAYDGTGWTALDSGLDGRVHALEVFDFGQGEVLIAGGEFSEPAGGLVPLNNIAVFDGVAWQPLGTSSFDGVRALEVHDDGQGPTLFAGASEYDVASQTSRHLHRWNGASWDPIFGLDRFVDSLVSVPQGSDLTPGLYVAASHQDFSTSSQAGLGLGRWDGASWNPVGTGIPGAMIHDLKLLNDGSQTALFAAYAGGGVDSGDRGFGRFGCGAAPRYVSKAGCSVLKPSMLPATGTLDLGTTTRLWLTGNTGAFANAWYFYLGLDGTDASGCGLELPGLGELLLDASQPIDYLGAGFFNPAIIVPPQISVQIPDDPSLAGKSIAVQAIGPNIGGLGLVRFSRSLVATLEPAP